jgi:hypothetical protein
MSGSTRPRALTLSIVALLLAVLAIFLVSRSGSGSSPNKRAAESAIPTTSAARAAADRSALSAADWMDKISRTPPSGRPGLMREILALQDESLRNEIATALALEWMSSDLDSYLAFVDSQQVEEGLASEAMKRFSVALMRSFESLSGNAELEGKMRYLAEAIVSYLIANDLDGAESWAREFLVGLDRDMALAKIAPAMVALSPERAVELFATIQAVSPRLTGASELGAALARRDPAAALLWADSLRGHSERTLAMGGVALTLAETDATRAASSLKAFLAKIQEEYTQLREEDRAKSGVKAADEFQTPDLYQEYLDTHGYVLMQPDTPEADYLLKAAEQIALQLAKSDPRGAIAWAESLAVGIAQAHSISGALSGWSRSAPREAVDHYLANYGYDPVIPLYLFENWAAKDPAAAVGALSELQNPAQKSSAIEGVTNGWLKRGSELPDLVRWVVQLPAGNDRDSATTEIISRTGDADPVAAWQLAMRISNPDARRRAASEVFTLLAADQPDRADAMLAQYKGPAEEIENLSRILSTARSSN